MLGAGGVTGFPFVVFADVYQARAFVGLKALEGFLDGDFVYAALGFFDEFKESFGVFHLFSVLASSSFSGPAGPVG